MTFFTTVSGPAAPLMAHNVDTDVIIPIRRLTDHDRHALGAFAFESWRYLADGTENPDFLLNREPWRSAPILLAGPNFGCGSSREGAVWALKGLGVRAVIAPSFGGIFFNNLFQNGMLPVALPVESIERFAEISHTEPGVHFTIDLERKLVVPPSGAPESFEVDEMRRQGLLQGLDDLGLTLTREAEISAFQTADRQRRPWVHES